MTQKEPNNTAEKECEPTNEALDKWAAEFMGWKWAENEVREDEQGAYYFTGWDGPNVELYAETWHPSTSHDQCQMVLEKLDAEEYGDFVQELWWNQLDNDNPPVDFDGSVEWDNLIKLLLATPRQKLLAVYRAVEGK